MSIRLRSSLVALLLLFPMSPEAATGSADEAYEGARRFYYVLKGDAARRKLRHHWLNAASQFEAVATRFPKSARAPDALFTAAELLEELSRISRLDEDLQGAIADYQRLCEGHPRH